MDQKHRLVSYRIKREKKKREKDRGQRGTTSRCLENSGKISTPLGVGVFCLGRRREADMGCGYSKKRDGERLHRTLWIRDPEVPSNRISSFLFSFSPCMNYFFFLCFFFCFWFGVRSIRRGAHEPFFGWKLEKKTHAVQLLSVRRGKVVSFRQSKTSSSEISLVVVFVSLLYRNQIERTSLHRTIYLRQNIMHSISFRLIYLNNFLELPICISSSLPSLLSSQASPRHESDLLPLPEVYIFPTQNHFLIYCRTSFLSI